MNHFWAALAWVWRRKIFFGTTLAAALFFFVWFFPFGDLSDFVTSAIARGTNNQIYVQFETMDLHLLPQPSISAKNVSVESNLPPLGASWAKITPSLFGVIFSLPTVMKAMGGDPEAAAAISSRLGLSVAAEDILGGDLSLSLGGGQKSEKGAARSRVNLALEKINLNELQRWSDLSVKMQGQLSVNSELQLTPDFSEPPDGEYDIQVSKFAMPAATVMIPMGEANLPVNVPTLTLANVVLKGRLAGGQLILEEGTFGQSKDPLFGKIKGQIALRLVANGGAVTPVFGAYNLTVDLNTTQMVEKELGFAFFTLGSAKTPAAGGGARYLFRASGNGIGYVPNITRINSF